MRQILGLCGYPGSGKDEIAKHLVGNYGFTRIAFADPLREGLRQLNPLVVYESELYRLKYLVDHRGWDWTKYNVPEVRELLQRYGTEAGRDIHGPDCWVNVAKRKLAKTPGNVVFTDVRFENEVALLRRNNATIIWVQRPGVGKINEHKSEQMDYGAMSDGVLVNNGSIEELYQTVDDYVGAVLNG